MSEQKVDEMLKAIINLPRAFAASGRSMCDLLASSGYFEMRDHVSEFAITNVLVKQPECVEDWFAYSQDKRTNEGWYVRLGTGGRYYVGSVSVSGAIQEKEYPDSIAACGAFVAREIARIGATPRRGGSTY